MKHRTGTYALRWLLGFALALALALGLSATAAAEEYNVWVGGVQVTSEKLSGPGWSYTPAADTTPATLTLNGATITGGYTINDTSSGGPGVPLWFAAIYAEGDLTIDVTADSTVTAPDNGIVFPLNSAGIYTTGSLTVTGAYKLTATGGVAPGTTCGVYAEAGNVTVEEGSTLTATGNTATNGSSYGVYANGNVTVNGTLTATGGTATNDSSYGVFAGGAVTVNGNGTLTATGGTANSSYGVWAPSGAVTVNANSRLTATGNTQAVYGNVKNSITGTGWTNTVGTKGQANIDVSTDQGQSLTNYKKVQFPGIVLYPVWVGGVRVTELNVSDVLGTADGDAATVTYTPATDTAAATLTLNGATITSGSYSNAAIYAKGDLTIDVTADSTVTGPEANLSYGISITGSLTVTGSGTLEAKGGTATNGSSRGVEASKAVTVTGTLNAEGGEATYNSYGVWADGAVNVNGTLNATGGTNGYGLNAENGSITLGYENSTDSITASSYTAGSVVIAEGKSFTIDSTNAYCGTLTSEQLTAIKGKTLVPAYSVMIADGITDGTVTASPAVFAIKDYAAASKTVALTLSPDNNYVIGSVSYNDGSEHIITPNAGVYSFTMPAHNVIVTATFLKSLSHSDITVSNIADQTYAGSAITPGITVKDGNKEMEQGKDYAISYKNNINAASSTAANAPTVTITGMGSYSGTRTVKFTIKQKFVTVGGIKAKDKAYDTTTSAALDYSGATFAGKVAGDDLTVTATGAFEDASAGKAKTVTFSGLTLGGDSKDNYVLAENGHQTTTTATIFRATPEVTAPTATFFDVITKTNVETIPYGTPLSNVELNNPTGNIEGTWTWATDNGINPNETAVGTVGTHVFRAKFTPEDTTNYCEITKDVTVTVGKATPHLTVGNFSAPYGHPVSVKSNCDSDGEVTYVFYKSDGETKTNTEDGAETEGGAPRNAGTYTIKASVAETSNYLSWEGTLADGCEIKPAPNPAVLRSPVSVKRGSSYDLSGLVSRAKGTVSFALNGSPAGYSLSGSTLTLADTTADSCTITVTADGTVDGKSNYETFSGELTVNATDLLPQDSFGFADVAQEKTYGDGDFIVAATGAETGSNVTYSSDDSEVAAVDAETGKVTIKKAGTATITATAGSTDTYASATASYKLTVNRKPVTIRDITADDMDYNAVTAQCMTLNTNGAVIDGMVDGDELTVSATGTCDADAGENRTVTIQTITLDGSSAGNYTVDRENSQKTTTINITKADIPGTEITAPTGKEGLVYTGLAQSLVNAGTAQGGKMRYALGTATTAPADNLYSASIPAAVNAGTYYVWYMVKGDRNHNDYVSNVRVEVPIGKASGKTVNADAVEVQKGDNIAASVNIRGYVGAEAVIEDGTSPQVTPDHDPDIRITDISVSNDKNNLTFKVSSVKGGNAIITVTLTSDNYNSVTLTIPVKVQDKVTEVKLDHSVESSVQDVTVDGLDDYTNSQSGESVKVVLKVDPVSAPQDSTVKTKIDNSVKVIFNGVEEGNIKTEYLDISIQKQVGTGNPVSVGDVERVLKLAIKYDLSGKFNPVVIREYEGTVTAFTALNAQPSESNYQDGTFYIDEDQGIVYIYSRYFSTFSIAYTTVNYAKITTYPVAVENLVYDGTEHALIKAGTATGGEIQYAVGVSDKSAPTTGWSISIPTATDAETYYVWYKVTGDENHDDTEPVCLTVTIHPAEPVITGADLVLDGTLTMRFHVALPAGFDDSSAHMSFTVHGRSIDVPLSDAGTVDGRRTFSCPVFSIEMAEPIDAQFHYTKDGKDKAATLTSSVKKYLDALEALDGNPEALTKLIGAIRDYGHYIQPYLARLHSFTVGDGGYAEMPAATASITPASVTQLDGFKTKWTRYDPDLLESVTYYDTFDTSTYLNIQVKLKSARTLTATVDGTAVEVTELGGNVYAVRTPGIAANNLGTPVKVVFYAGSTVICDIDVSALTYVRAVLASGRNERDELEALTAFYNYYTAANAYADSNRS